MDLEKEFECYKNNHLARERFYIEMVASEIFQAITTGKAAIDGFKLLKEYVDGVQDTLRKGELIRAIGDLNLELSETQSRLAEQIRENINLKAEIDQLKTELAKLADSNSQPVIKDGVYYFGEDGPFCTGCYDTKKLSVRLKHLQGPFITLGRFQCPNCGTTY